MPRKLTIEDMRRIATERGGKCLANDYLGGHKPIPWLCGDCGHQWNAAPSSIKSGTWCPECGKKKIGLDNPRRGSIEKVRQLAFSRGGECLSAEYMDANTKLRWRCSKGHEWDAVPNSIKRGTWCLICAGIERKTIEQMQKFAAERGGKCLSAAYVNSRTPLRWQCGDCGHEWEASPSNIIINKSWCPKCSGNLAPNTEEIQALARERGGECLSTKYVRNNTKLRWKCACGNVWSANWNNVKNGSWCPKCQSGLGERICRAFFEQLFDASFPPAHPAWLPSASARNFELDGYSERLSIAFEHHGRHHYEIIGFGVEEEQAKRKHREVKRRDKLKAKICKKHGVVLITVPEIPLLLPLADVRDFIKAECEKAGVTLPDGFNSKAIDLSPAYQSFRALKRLELLHAISEEHGGKCLSDYYVNNKTRLRFRCAEGHEWDAPPTTILNSKSWCKICSGNSKLSIEAAHRVANERGGRCLSVEYINSKTHLSWKCGDCGHEWKANLNAIKNGHWCPKCWEARRSASRRRLAIEEMQDIAHKRGGECMSAKYVNNRTKLKWKCGVCDHEWDATPTAIMGGTWKEGSWCPECWKKRAAQKHRIGSERA